MQGPGNAEASDLDVIKAAVDAAEDALADVLATVNVTFDRLNH